jgi:gas vesicle protein
MAELEIHHEGNESDPMGKTVGVIAAIVAVLLAIVTIASHRTHTAAIMHKSGSNDQWAYYQATRVKLHSTELGQNLVSTLGGKSPAAEKLLKEYESQKKKYEETSKEIQEKARGADESAEADEHRALRYDVGEGLLEIGLVLSSLYFISRKKMFPVLGVICAVTGTAIAITGFMM